VLLFILMMCRHPEIQRNAQREVDALTSEDNIPRMEDALKLPFVKCIMQELFRFAPPAPLLVHSPIEDDIYQGFLIPKGITRTERKSTYLISIRLNGDGKCLVGCISAILTRLTIVYNQGNVTQLSGSRLIQSRPFRRDLAPTRSLRVHFWSRKTVSLKLNFPHTHLIQ
jgi:hypothetical protein